MTQSQISIYKSALKEARASFERATNRLDEITHESYILTEEIDRLRRTITALAAMCTEEPGIDNLGITESCLEVMQAEKGTLTTVAVVKALEARGFDMASQKNAPASVHAVLARLARKEKIVRVTEPETSAVAWRGPNFDPKYDGIPF